MLKNLFLLPFFVLTAHAVADDVLPPVTLYSPTVCFACVDYADHLRKNGFTVTVKPTDDMAAVKRRFKVPKHLQAEPSAMVGVYFVEGHVPAAQVLDLSKRADLRGLAVPGMPHGSPGMEMGGAVQAYQVIGLDQQGVDVVVADYPAQ